MNKLALIAAALLVSLQGCVLATTNIKGSGNKATDVRPIYNVEEIHVSQAIRCEIEQSNENTVTVETDDNILPYVQTVVEDGELKIRLEPGISVRDNAIKVRVLTPNFGEVHANSAANVKVGQWTTGKAKVEASSAATITCTDITAEEVEVGASSAATCNVSVKSREVEAGVSSAGTIWIGGEADKVEADASSGARINVDCKFKELDADASSGANIHYKHDFGKIKISTSSGGSVSNN